MPKKILKVIWGDAWCSSEWTEEDDIEKFCSPEEVVTVGTLVYENEKGILLAGSYIEDQGLYNEVSFIPRGMVASVVEIAESGVGYADPPF
jgi:hypothetical protein